MCYILAMCSWTSSLFGRRAHRASSSRRCGGSTTPTERTFFGWRATRHNLKFTGTSLGSFILPTSRNASGMPNRHTSLNRRKMEMVITQWGMHGVHHAKDVGAGGFTTGKAYTMHGLRRRQKVNNLSSEREILETRITDQHCLSRSHPNIPRYLRTSQEDNKERSGGGGGGGGGRETMTVVTGPSPYYPYARAVEMLGYNLVDAYFGLDLWTYLVVQVLDYFGAIYVLAAALVDWCFLSTGFSPLLVATIVWKLLAIRVRTEYSTGYEATREAATKLADTRVSNERERERERENGNHIRYVLIPSVYTYSRCPKSCW